MTIRIWHQSFTVLSDLVEYDAALKEHFARVSQPGTQIDMHGMAAGTYPSNYPGDDIKFCAYQYLHGLQFLLNGLQAQADGYDAYAISTLPEPALLETRSLVDIPVVGYGESAMREAREAGYRFGVLVFIDELADLVAANAQKYGLADHFVAARPAGFRFDDVLSGFGRADPVVDRFRVAARGLIDAGATAIIPGEAPLNVLLAREGITHVDGVRIIDSLGAWVRCAESAVLAQRGVEKCDSGSGYFHARPELSRTRDIIRFYGLDTFLDTQEYAHE